MDEDEEQEITAYEMSVTEGDELKMRIAVGDKERICYMKVNQAFSFITLFIVTLGQMVSLAYAEGDLGIFLGKKKGPGGEDPTGSSSLLH